MRHGNVANYCTVTKFIIIGIADNKSSFIKILCISIPSNLESLPLFRTKRLCTAVTQIYICIDQTQMPKAGGFP